jgi:serine/threonine protein kinase
VIAKVLKYGPHPNIVPVLAHGSLSAPFYYYYADMELCEFTLDSYIHDRQVEPLGAPLLRVSAVPLAFSNDFSLLRAANVLTILQNTSEGLSFLHQYQIVHRDLKPKNSTSNQLELALTFSFVLPQEYAMENHRLWNKCRGYIQKVPSNITSKGYSELSSARSAF